MFCRIYLATRTKTNNADLVQILSEILNQQLFNGRYIEYDGFSIEVRNNKDYDQNKAKEFPDGFLFFKHSAEIEMDSSISARKATEVITKILTHFWDNRFAAIASCEFEESLPEKGGYKSRSVPWPDSSWEE